MSQAPPNLEAQRQILAAVTGIKGNWGIVGECGSRRDDGYHLALADITKAGCGRGIYDPETNPHGDYSTRRLVDRRWLSQYSSGFDFGSKLGIKRLKALTAFMEKQGKAGKLPGVVEFLGPRADGRAVWMGRTNGWEPVLLQKGNSHEWHGHESVSRKLTHPDSGFPDLYHLIEPFFGPRPDVLPPEPEPPPEPVPPDDDEFRRQIAALMAEIERIALTTQESVNGVLEMFGVKPLLVEDGDFGPKTTAAVEGLPTTVRTRTEALHIQVSTMAQHGAASVEDATEIEQRAQAIRQRFGGGA